MDKSPNKVCGWTPIRTCDRYPQAVICAATGPHKQPSMKVRLNLFILPYLIISPTLQFFWMHLFWAADTLACSLMLIQGEVASKRPYTYSYRKFP